MTLLRTPPQGDKISVAIRAKNRPNKLCPHSKKAECGQSLPSRSPHQVTGPIARGKGGGRLLSEEIAALGPGSVHPPCSLPFRSRGGWLAGDARALGQFPAVGPVPQPWFPRVGQGLEVVSG